MAEKPYQVKVQLKDTIIEMDTEAKMNEVFDNLVRTLTQLGVPSDNIILVGANLTKCDEGFIHNHDIRRHPPEPSPGR